MSQLAKVDNITIHAWFNVDNKSEVKEFTAAITYDDISNIVAAIQATYNNVWKIQVTTIWVKHEAVPKF